MLQILHSKQHNFRLDSLPVAIVYVLHIIFGITKLLYFEEQRVSKLLHDSFGGRQLPFSQSKLPLPQCFIRFSTNSHDFPVFW